MHVACADHPKTPSAGVACVCLGCANYSDCLAQPIANASLIAKELGVTPRAAQNLVAELGLREATGTGRYRAWGIL